MNSKNYFDHIATQWNAMRKNYFNQDIRPIIFSKVDFKQKTVMDLGSGTGYLALEISKLANLVFAVDQSHNMLDQLMYKAKSNQLNNVFTIKSDIQSIAFLSNQIDVITMNMALHHMPSPNEVIKEMYQLLKDDGRVVIGDVMSHQGEWAIEEMHDVWLGFKKEQIIHWLEDNHFTDIEFIETNYQAVATSKKGEVINPNIFVVVAKKESKNEI